MRILNYAERVALEKKYQTSLNYDKRLLQAQAEITRAETLKEVGERVIKEAGSADGFPEFHATMLVFAHALLRGELEEPK